MVTTKHVEQSTQFHVDDVHVGVMRVWAQDGVPTARLLVTVDGASQVLDLHANDQIDFDDGRELALDEIDLAAEPSMVRITVRTAR